MAEEQQDLTRRTAVGMAWAYGSYAGGRLLVLVATAILARLLTPEEFGLVALALAFTAFLDMLKDFGVAEALIIVDEDDLDDKADTAFVIMIVCGVLLVGVTAVLGPLTADLYDEPDLTLIVPVLGVSLLLRSIGLTHYALSQKMLDFRTRTKAELADVIVRGVVGVGLALSGAGAWSLVLGYVAGTAAMTLTLWLSVAWRPRFKPQRAHLRELLGFGGALTGVSLMGAILGNVDKLIIGAALGAAPLGLYTLASRLPELLIINLSIVAGQVLFPAFASVDREALRDAFLTSLRYAALVGLPLAAFLGVLAEPLILAAFGDQWLDAVGVMQLFVLYALSSPITLVCGTVFKARGRGALLLRMSIFQVALVIPSILLVAERGIVAVAIVHAAVSGIIVVVSLVVAMRMLGARVGPVAHALWPPTFAALALAAACWGVDHLIGGEWLVIAVAAAIGAPLYLGLLWLVARDSMQRLLAAFLPRLGRTPPPPPPPAPAPVATP